MLNISSSLFASVLQVLDNLNGNDVSEALLPALASSLEHIDDLLYYALSEEEEILIQSQDVAKGKALGDTGGHTLFQGSLTARYAFRTPKSEVEIKAFGNLVFMILKLHQRYTEVQVHLQQEKNQTLEALRDLRQTQRELVEAEKMGALGGLLAGMAHELNTPLGIAITAMSTLQEEIMLLDNAVETGTLSKSHMKKTLQNMQDAGQLIGTHLNQAALLIQDFKRVSPRQAYEAPQMIDLKEHIHQIITTLRQDHTYQHIHFEIAIPHDVFVYTFPNVWTQIVNEWARNAHLHGFKDNASPTISLQLEPFQAEPQQGMQALFSLMDHRLESAEGQTEKIQQSPQHWRLTYRDNGTGIEAALKPIVFEPFSTRSKSAFSGLGLYMVYNLVHQKLNGEIYSVFPKDGGTGFEIIFPHIEKSETKPL
jgi:signal transduction histidine kinase